MYRKFFYDSPLIGFDSLNVNTRRDYSTLSSNKHNKDDLQIDPWFITGFSDGEGCFSCSVLKSSSYKIGWEVQPIFQIKLHVRDFPILLKIQHSLGGIGIVSSNQSSCAFRVKKFRELIELIIFFDKYPLISRKRGDYLLFKQILSIIQLKEHLTLQGLQKIINIKATLNFGLSKELQLMFPETVPVPRPLRETCVIPHSQWMAGPGICLRENRNFSFTGGNLPIPLFGTPSHAFRINSNALLKKTYIKQFSSKIINNYLSLPTNERKQVSSLVVWGTNLTSTVGMGRFTKQVRDTIQLPKFQKSVIIGLILSDGWLRFASKTSKSTLLGLKQSLAHSDYLWFVFSSLSHYCNNTPILRKGIRAGIPFYGLEFVTRSLPCFTELYEIFYINGVKVIPNNIYELLTPVAFAHLILGDGGFKSKGIYLCTDSYAIQDVVRLMNVLIIRYELKCTLHKASNGKGYRIYISRNSVSKVIDIVLPYLTPSMYYKVGIVNNGSVKKV